MKMPITELIDRISIMTLKNERFLSGEKPLHSYAIYKKAFDSFLCTQDAIHVRKAKFFYKKLYSINKFGTKKEIYEQD